MKLFYKKSATLKELLKILKNNCYMIKHLKASHLKIVKFNFQEKINNSYYVVMFLLQSWLIPLDVKKLKMF